MRGVRLRSIASVAISILILVLGWSRIQQKVRESPSINDDGILTLDELQNLPAGTLVAVVPQVGGSSPETLGYRILRLALERSGEPFALGYGFTTTDQEQSVQRMASSSHPSRGNPSGLTVGFFGVGKDINARLRPVPIPLFGGLLGVRGLFVNRYRRERFQSVHSLEDLLPSTAIQGIGWSDVGILENAGIRTYTTEPSAILEILNQDRIDFYPKGINELEKQHQLIRRNYPSVELDRHILLAYPFAMMFYVNPDNHRLHRAILTGLRRAHADGSYERLLRTHVFTPWLRRTLRLGDRTVIPIRNPDAVLLTSTVDPSYWIVPWRSLMQGRLRQGDQLCIHDLLRDLCQDP